MFNLPEKYLSERYNQKGQALLIVLLTMAVILTIVLSVVSRSVTDVTVSTYEEEALRAFSAAEAGVEKSLLNPVPVAIPQTYPDPGDTSLTYQVAVDNPTETDKSFIYPSLLKSGDTATFWLVSHATNGSLTCSGGLPCFTGSGIIRVCWGNPPEASIPMAQRPAVEIMLFYDQVNPHLSVAQPLNDYNNLRVARLAFDRNASSHGNGFDSGVNLNCTIEGKNFLYRSGTIAPPTIPNCNNEPGCRLLIKVRMYYNNTPQPVGLLITGGTDLPAQGFSVSSTGVSGQSTRRVNVFQTYAEPPTLFDNAIFSMKDIPKP